MDQFADVTGVHELDITQTPDGRTLALLAVPDIEAITSNDQGPNGTDGQPHVRTERDEQPVVEDARQLG